MYVPSVDANVFSSRRKLMNELTKRAPAFIAASFAASSSATLSATGTVNGSTLMGLFHSPPGVGVTGASVTGFTSAARFALACAAACFAAFVTPSAVSSRVAANPHAPPTSVRTPTPNVSLSASPCTRRSRVATNCWRYLPTRTSA